MLTVLRNLRIFDCYGGKTKQNFIFLLQCVYLVWDNPIFIDWSQTLPCLECIIYLTLDYFSHLYVKIQKEFITGKYVFNCPEIFYGGVHHPSIDNNVTMLQKCSSQF